MKIQGKELIVSAANNVFGGATNCTITFSGDVIEKSSPTSGKWKDYIAGRCGWRISTDGFILSEQHGGRLMTLIGTKVSIVVSISAVQYTGSAIVSNVQLNGNVKELAKYSVQLQGCGELV